MKISKTYFNMFRKEFLRWVDKLGLKQYSISFFHEYLEENYAQVSVDELNKNAKVILTTELDGLSIQGNPGPEILARHEVSHLLTHRLIWLGKCRYIDSSDLNEEWEALAMRLEKVLK